MFTATSPAARGVVECGIHDRLYFPPPLLTIPTLLLVSVIVFGLIRLIPGDPAEVMMGPDADPASVASLHHQMGLDRPLPVQFFAWAGRVLHGDLGVSVATGEPVVHLIVTRFQLTAAIVLVSVSLATLIAVSLGMIAAWRRNSGLDLAVVGGATISKVPSFWLGLVLLWFWSQAGLAARVGYVPSPMAPAPRCCFLFCPSLRSPSPRAACDQNDARQRHRRSQSGICHPCPRQGLPERTALARHVFPNAFAPTLTWWVCRWPICWAASR